MRQARGIGVSLGHIIDTGLATRSLECQTGLDGLSRPGSGHSVGIGSGQSYFIHQTALQKGITGLATRGLGDIGRGGLGGSTAVGLAGIDFDCWLLWWYREARCIWRTGGSSKSKGPFSQHLHGLLNDRVGSNIDHFASGIRVGGEAPYPPCGRSVDTRGFHGNCSESSIR